MRKWIIGVIVVAALAAAGFYFYSVNNSEDGSVALPFVGGDNAPTPTPLPVVRANPDIIVDAVVKPVRYASLSLSSGGAVTEVPVAEGDVVDEGALLLRLDNEMQLIAVAQANSQLERAQASLAELLAGSRVEEIEAAQAAVDGAQANLQRLLDGPRPEDVAAAEAGVKAARARYLRVVEGADEEQLIQAEANLRNAEAEMQRAQRAYNQVKWSADAGALPQAAALQVATNNYEAAKASSDLLVKGARSSEIAAASADIDQAQAVLDKALAPVTEPEIDAVRAEVRRAKAQLAQLVAGARPETIQAVEADVKSAATALMQQQSALADTELHAPFAGTIASLDARVGEQVNPGVPLVQLADQSNWLVETDDLTEIDVVNVSEGDSVHISIDALPDLELTGTVINIKPLGESKQGDITYTVTVQPDQHDDRLRWNMTAAVRITPQE